MKSKRSPKTDLDNIIPILINVWRRFRKEPGPADRLQTREFRSVVTAVKALQKKWENDKNLIGQDYFAKHELLGAYMLYQWIIHYQQGLSLLNELPITPERVLDVCSGPAAFAFAALKHGANEVYATDRNLSALQLGADICGKYGMPISIREWNCLKSPIPVPGKFDLIIVGHCLHELYPPNEKGWQEKQQKFIEYLLGSLSPQGFLLIVEDSHSESNLLVLGLRDHFVKNGIPVQAPCIWRGECPALKSPNSPCYAQRELEKPYLIKEIQRAAQINLGSLKMSYVIFRNPIMQWPKLPDQKLYRIISPPVESFQGKHYYLCGTERKKKLGSHLQEHSAESRAFEYLRRGDLISIEDALETHRALDIIQGTKVKIEAACGQPLNEKF